MVDVIATHTASQPLEDEPDSTVFTSIELAATGSDFRVARALGSRVFDDCGQSYLDLCMGHGSLMLGHGATVTKEALRQQLESGWLFGFSHDISTRLAKLIQSAGPANERVVLCASESDATLLAMRAARALTGRDMVAVFSGATHGLHDGALVTAHFERAVAANDVTFERKAHIGAGVPASIDQSICVLPFGSDQAFNMIVQNANKLAAVIVDPLSSAHPSLAHGGWLRELEKTCRENAVAFILDEATSGFRLSYGGAQQFFGLTPDLVTYGNALGGGLPIGAVAGRAQIMAAFGGGAPQQRIYCGSTHAGNPLSAAAAEAILGVLSEHRETVYAQLHEATARIAQEFNAAARKANVNAQIDAAGSMFRVSMKSVDAHKAMRHEQLFYKALLDQRVIVHASQRCFLSTAHTLADINELISALLNSITALKAA